MKQSLYIKYFLSFAVLFSLTIVSEISANDSTIFSAMSDEMDRSMNELQYKDYEKPFFITYGLTKNTSANIKASLGALINSSKRTGYYPSVRLIIGDYQLNDEKFSDHVNKVSNNDGSSPIPLDLNYWGIRRSFWLATNNVYKNASEKYKNKVGLMAQNNMSKDDMTSPDFSKEQAVVKLLDELPEEISLEQLENIGKDISEVFLSEPDIVESSVVIEYQNNVIYNLNSEGSKTKRPFRLYNIIVRALIVAEDNKTFTQVLKYNVKSINELPTMAEMKSDAAMLVENLKITANANDLESTYFGPVLFLDNAISQLILTGAFQQNSGFIARPNSLVYNKSKGLYYGNDKWESFKNKKVIDRKVSITSIPTKTEFKNESLLGYSFSFDMEAVEKPDTLAIVENGVLLNQLNGRAPTTSQHNSNGHMNFYVSKTRFTNMVGPGVIKVSSSETSTLEELYTRQKELAEEEGNEFVIMVKTLESNADINPINYYKVDLVTGKEELLQTVSYNQAMTSFRSIEGLSDNYIMQNLLVLDKVVLNNRMKRYSGYPEEIKEQLRQSFGTQGTPTSFIFPDALLMKNVEMKGSSGAIHTKSRTVPNPMEIQN